MNDLELSPQLPEELPNELVELVELPTDIPRPFLTTPFASYTVAEGLLLMLLVLCVVEACIRLLKGGFSWL